MKKTLLLTTLIILGAGTGHADVSLSGDGRMGLMSADGGETLIFESRARVRFSLSSETDSGLKFGGQFRANDASGASAGTKGSVFIEMPEAGRFSMGDVDGAAQTAILQLPFLGYTDASNKLQEFRFLTGSDGIDLLYAYTKDALGVYASLGNPGAPDGSGKTENGDDRSVGVAYTTEFWRLAAGFEDNGANTQTVLSGSYGNGQAEGKLIFGVRDDDAKQYAFFGTYIVGNTTLSAFYRNDFDEVGYHGVGVSHDLGSGLALAGSYARQDDTDAVVTLGAAMSF